MGLVGDANWGDQEAGRYEGISRSDWDRVALLSLLWL